MNKQRFILLVACIVLLLMGLLMVTAPVFAQGGEATQEPVEVIDLEEPEITVGFEQPEDIIVDLQGWLEGKLEIPSLMGLVIVLTAFSKRVIPESVPSRMISFVWVIVIYAAYYIATQVGVQQQFDDYAQLFVRVGDVLLEGGLVAIASHYGYTVSNNAGVPFIGESRSTEIQTE